MSPDGLVVVVLAGGEGRRMAGGKPGRLLGGTSLIERAVGLALGWAEDVAIALREPGQATTTEGVEVLIDDPTIPGPLAGVASAQTYARRRAAEAALTIPCDAPFLPQDLAARLAATLADGVGVAIARSGGRLHPTCALWRAGLELELGAYAATGRGSLMGLAEAVGWAAADWPAEPVDPFFNVNTPEDLARAERMLRDGAANV